MEKAGRIQDGYLTVFLALSLTVILSLFLTLIEAARMNAVKMQIECACNIASDSVLAEFSRELYKRYDLLFIDTSYGTGNPSLHNTEKHFKSYMDGNFRREGGFGKLRDFTFLTADSVKIQKTRFIADNGCRALREQVYAYMSADPAGSVTAPLLVQADRFHGFELRGPQIEQQRVNNIVQLNSALERSGQGENPDPVQDTSVVQKSSDGQTMLRSMVTFTNTPLLSQVLGSGVGISAKTVRSGELFSRRAYHTGNGLCADDSHRYPQADELLFDEYLYTKCGDMVTQRDESALQYELEYIVAGKDKDSQNLEKTARRILLARYASNYACLSSDRARCAQAGTVAGAIAVILMNPELKPLCKKALLLAWSYLESIRDLQILFAGGGVPLVKEPSGWNTKLSDMLHPWSMKSRAVTTSPSLQNPGYEDYLRAILYLEGAQTKNRRFLDLCEMNVRMSRGNEQFRADWCMDTFAYTAGADSAFGYHFVKKRTVGYN